MKTKNLCVLFCAAIALVGCAGTNRQVSEVSFDEKNPPCSEAPAAPAQPQPAVPDERAFRKLDLNGDEAVTLDEWQHFDTSTGAKENFSALDENGDGRINVTEFPTQAPKHSKRYHFLGDTDKTDDSHVSSDNEIFQQQTWQLFSFHF